MVLVAPPVSAQKVSFAKQKAIIELMEVTGAQKLLPRMAKQMGVGMAQSMHRTNPKIPPEALAILVEELEKTMKEATPGLMAHMVTIYARNFSEKEVRDMIAFYQTETGRKTLTVMPKLMQESMQASMKIMSSIGPGLRARVRERLKREGLLPTPQP